MGVDIREDKLGIRARHLAMAQICSVPQNTLFLTSKAPISKNYATFLKPIFFGTPCIWVDKSTFVLLRWSKTLHSLCRFSDFRQMILSPSYVLTFSSGVIKNQVQYQMVSQLKINGLQFLFKQKSNIYLIYLEIFVVNFCKTLIKN